MPYTEQQKRQLSAEIQPGVEYSFDLKPAPEMTEGICPNFEGYAYQRFFSGVMTARSTVAEATELGIDHFTICFTPGIQATLPPMYTYQSVLRHTFGLLADIQQDQNFLGHLVRLDTDILKAMSIILKKVKDAETGSILVEFDAKNLRLTIKKI